MQDTGTSTSYVVVGEPKKLPAHSSEDRVFKRSYGVKKRAPFARARGGSEERSFAKDE